MRGTKLIAETIAELDPKPRVLVCASAIGYYGNRGDEILDESSPSGEDFLADVCVQWENACTPAREAGIRVANMRLGVVLSATGGALAQMLTPFKLGVGGILGSGKQYLSWISLHDAVEAIQYVIQNEQLRGPVNLVAPTPVTNQQFTKALGKVLSRPTILPMPAFAARMVFGEMADALLLASTRVAPKLLSESGFSFQHPDVDTALQHVLRK